INKVDRPNANPAEALDQTFDLFIELGAKEEQADFPVLYGSGLDGWAVKDLEKEPHEGMDARFQTIVAYVPAPVVNREAPFLMQVSTLAWNEYTGRIGCGRVLQGSLHKGEDFLRYSTRWKNNRQKKDGWEVYSEEKTRSVQMWVTH